MTNPFTYCELHSKDAKKARAFYGALFDWKLRECVEIPDGIFSVLRDPGGAQVGIFEPRKR